MKATVYCPDLECESCEKVLSKALQRVQGIQTVTFTPETLQVDYDPNQVTKEHILETINSKGYRAAFEPFEQKTFKERLRSFRENKQKYAVEYRMLLNAAVTFAVLVVLEAIAYVGLFQSIPNFLARYGWWMFYANLAVVSIAAAMWHVRAYRTRLTTMVGMMIGMTFGMQTGIMIGTILAATNGLFIGGLVGMLSAVFVGVLNGRCCGIMGVLEGAMAGVMGGLMGSMIGTMFFVDNILWLMPFFFAINITIMWGLSYLLLEHVEGRTAQQAPTPLLTFASYCIIANALLIALMTYGPKTGLAALGGP